MMKHDTIVILDYGSQYTQLIARRIREAQVYCEIFHWRTPAEKILALNPKGFILGGGPNSVYDEGAPTLPSYVMESNVPILGVCYGMQLLAHNLGGKVASSTKREYGRAHITLSDTNHPLFEGVSQEPDQVQVWMSYEDKVEQLPDGFTPIAHTDNAPFAATADDARRYYAVQFHPEVVHTLQGTQILRNFVHSICECNADWTPQNFIEQQVAAIDDQLTQALDSLTWNSESAWEYIQKTREMVKVYLKKPSLQN